MIMLYRRNITSFLAAVFLVLAVFLPISEAQRAKAAEQPNREWTILIYYDGDNNLEQYMLDDLKEIGVDSLAYLSVDAAHRLAGDNGCRYCDGCFTGVYPIDIPDGQGKNKFEQPIHGGNGVTGKGAFHG